jgi:hypothetical protein
MLPCTGLLVKERRMMFADLAKSHKDLGGAGIAGGALLLLRRFLLRLFLAPRHGID